MTSAFYQAGFDVWDTTMTDFLEGKVNLDKFRGIAFVGGFSYADVLDSAKGWAGVIKFNKEIYEQFQKFYSRPIHSALVYVTDVSLRHCLDGFRGRGLKTNTSRGLFIMPREGLSQDFLQ